jgi:SAM-dependent methyltransferase
MNGVADRATFRCAPMERVDLDPASVDIVWIHAFLHHVIPDIRSVLSKVRDAIRPGGLVVIAEPVSLSPLLRRLRFAVARFSEHTPDERPLEQRELDLIREVFPEMHVRYFRGVSRLDRFVLPDHQYESASSWRRAAIVCLSICDYMLLSLPWFRRVASGVVISARL